MTPQQVAVLTFTSALVVAWLTGWGGAAQKLGAQPPPQGPKSGLAGDDLAALVGPQTTLYVAVADAAVLRRQLSQSPWVAQLTATPWWRQNLAPHPALEGLRAAQEFWPSAFGVPLSDDFDTHLGHHTALAIVNTPPKQEGPDHQNALVLGRSTQPSDLTHWLQRYLALERQAGKPVAVVTSHGRPVASVGGNHIVDLDGVWAMSEQRELITTVLERQAQQRASRFPPREPGAELPLASLAELPGYQAARAHRPANTFAHLYWNVPADLATQTAALPASPHARLQALMGAVRGVSLAVQVAGDASRLDGQLTLCPAPWPAQTVKSGTAGQTVHPFLRAVAGSPAAAPNMPNAIMACPDAATWRLIPADSVAAAAWSLSPAQTREAMEVIWPELCDDLATQIFLDGLFKVYAERFGPQFALVARRLPPQAGSAAVRPPAVAFVARLADPSVTRSVSHQLMAWLTRLNAQYPGLADAAHQPAMAHGVDKLVGQSVSVLDLDPLWDRLGQSVLIGAVKPAMTVIEGHLVVASHVSLIEAIAATAAGRAPALIDRPDLASRLGPANARISNAWATVSVAELADLLAENRSALVYVAATDFQRPVEDVATEFDNALEALRLFESLTLTRDAPPGQLPMGEKSVPPWNITFRATLHTKAVTAGR